MKNFYKYLIFLAVILELNIFNINNMDNQNNVQLQPTTQLKVPHPSSLIDPKTGKLYTSKADAWNAFWDIFYVWCQRKENEKNDLLIKKQQAIEEFKKNTQKSFSNKESKENKNSKL